MSINKVSASRGAAWVNESIGLLKTGGKSIWFPALIVGVLGSLPFIGALLGILIIFFYAGLVLCFSQTDGRFSVFSGFQDGRLARLMPILLLNIALAALAIIAMWPSLQLIMEAGMQGTKLSEEQAIGLMMNFGKQLLWLIPASIFINWITQFAVPLAAINDIPGSKAILQALNVIKVNWPALLVNFACFFVVVIICSIVIMLPMMLVSAALAAKPLLMNIAIMPFTTILTAVMVALMSGNMLFSYRDVFGADESTTTDNSALLI